MDCSFALVRCASVPETVCSAVSIRISLSILSLLRLQEYTRRGGFVSANIRPYTVGLGHLTIFPGAIFALFGVGLWWNQGFRLATVGSGVCNGLASPAGLSLATATALCFIFQAMTAWAGDETSSSREGVFSFLALAWVCLGANTVLVMLAFHAWSAPNEPSYEANAMLHGVIGSVAPKLGIDEADLEPPSQQNGPRLEPVSGAGADAPIVIPRDEGDASSASTFRSDAGRITVATPPPNTDVWLSG